MTVISAEMGAHPVVLDRPEAYSHVADNFSEPVETIESMVNYGTHLLMRSWVSSKRELKDTVVLWVLYKQCLGLADAASEMIRAGCIDPSALQLRALFEASVYLDWILRHDSKRRAKAYYVANLRRRLTWARRVIPGTLENRRFAVDVKDLNGPLGQTPQEIIDGAQEEVDAVEKFLKRPSLRQMNKAFDRRKRGRFDPSWYKCVFPKGKRITLFTLCKQVRRVSEYRLIYDSGSEVMHSSTYQSHVAFEGKTIRIKSLRSLDDLGRVLQLVFSELLHVLSTIHSNYRPEEAAQFADHYKSNWRKMNLTQYSVDYSYTEKVVE